MAKKESSPALINCQLNVLSEAGKELSFWDSAKVRWRKKIQKWSGRAKRFINHPTIIFAKLRSIFISSEKKSFPRSFPGYKLLGLKPGEMVRVKSSEEIEKTLNEKGQCEGISYIRSVMNKYCGGVYRVKKRINLFFDERRWRLSKLQNVVILDGVFCESPPTQSEDWSGCDRTCFLFWKEAWLERVTEDAPH